MQGQIIATIREPRVPERQVQSVEGKCGEHLLSISGFGVARPGSLTARVSLGRSELAITPELRDYLSVPMPERYNRAGLFLQQEGADLRVTAVGRGSPAHLLGIETGDRLKNAELGEFVKWMSLPQGTVRDLDIERSGTVRTVSLRLADFL